MSNENITPIDHSSGSALATKAGGTVWGGFKGGLGATALWVAGFTILGAWLLSGLMTGGLTLALPTVGAGTFWAVVGGLLGLGAGLSTWYIPAIGGTAIGGIAGGAKASERVNQERAAAQQLQAEVAIAQAQAPQTNNYGIDPRFNQAGSRIQADSAVNDGRLSQLALQRA